MVAYVDNFLHMAERVVKPVVVEEIRRIGTFLGRDSIENSNEDSEICHDYRSLRQPGPATLWQDTSEQSAQQAFGGVGGDIPSYCSLST